MSVGVPGAKWITIKEIRVIPRSMGNMSINLLRRYSHIGSREKWSGISAKY
jgi:hypothetical protein